MRQLQARCEGDCLIGDNGSWSNSNLVYTQLCDKVRQMTSGKQDLHLNSPFRRCCEPSSSSPRHDADCCGPCEGRAHVAASTSSEVDLPARGSVDLEVLREQQREERMALKAARRRARQHVQINLS